MGSPANAVVRDYLVGELRGLGVTPQVQRATAAYYPVPGLLQAGTVENVLARLPGTAPSGKAFLLAAHYDSVPTGPGATDNGSGVASALETLRALKAGPALHVSSSCSATVRAWAARRTRRRAASVGRRRRRGAEPRHSRQYRSRSLLATGTRAVGWSTVRQGHPTR
jgi:hypothetical protein